MQKTKSPDWKAGFEAARILYEGRYNFATDPIRQCAIARRLAVICPTCGMSEFDWCKYVGGKNKGAYLMNLHVSRQAK